MKCIPFGVFCLFSRVENVHMVCSSTVIMYKNMRFDTDFMQALVNWPHDSYAQFNLNCTSVACDDMLHANA